MSRLRFYLLNRAKTKEDIEAWRQAIKDATRDMRLRQVNAPSLTTTEVIDTFYLTINLN